MPQGVGQHLFRHVGQVGLVKASDGAFDVIGDTMQGGPAVFPNRVAQAWIAIARQADTSRVDDRRAIDLQYVGLMCVPHANHIDPQSFDALFPEVGISGGVFLHRIPGRGMHEEEASLAQCEVARQRQLGEETTIVGRDSLLRHQSGDAREIPKSGLTVGRDAMRDHVIVITPNTGEGMASNPSDHRTRVAAVIDQIAQTETKVERLV